MRAQVPICDGLMEEFHFQHTHSHDVHGRARAAFTYDEAKFTPMYICIYMVWGIVWCVAHYYCCYLGNRGNRMCVEHQLSSDRREAFGEDAKAICVLIH